MTEKVDLHDFLNNGIRIEILTKLIADSIQKSESIDSEVKSDIQTALESHFNFIEKL